MIRRIRLASGIVLMLFVVTHFINHALGLVSLEALEAGRRWFLLLWRNPLGTAFLYGALATHLLLALWALFERRSFRLRFVDWLQLALGLAIPAFLTLHILGTRVASSFFGTEDGYLYTLTILFVLAPELGVQQLLLMLLLWVHGTIGLHQWWRLKPAYRRVRDVALVGAVLLPAAAYAGVGVAVRDLLALGAQPGWVEETLTRLGAPGPEALRIIYALERWTLIGLAIALLAVLLARPLREALRLRAGKARITYPGGRRVVVSAGHSILEASRQAGIAHASVCGGRGRCSTCRVRVVAGLEALPEPSSEEAQVLQRIRAAADVRLACQTRPVADCTVVPLLAPSASVDAAGPEPGYRLGQEREITVLFADLRDFTSLAEERLPYDLVFVLNRYFAAMGKAVEDAGGYVDKFIGDGVMALFGIEGAAEQGTKDALRAAARMAIELEQLNQALERELGRPLRIGIGLHRGPVILGEMGYGEARGLTAVGDTVNAASRLEGMTKDFGVQLVVSQTVMDGAEEVRNFATREVVVRGREKPLTVHLVPDASCFSASGSVASTTRRATS
jgi:adenylate cyclase